LYSVKIALRCIVVVVIVMEKGKGKVIEQQKLTPISQLNALKDAWYWQYYAYDPKKSMFI